LLRGRVYRAAVGERENDVVVQRADKRGADQEEFRGTDQRDGLAGFDRDLAVGRHNDRGALLDDRAAFGETDLAAFGHRDLDTLNAILGRKEIAAVFAARGRRNGRAAGAGTLGSERRNRTAKRREGERAANIEAARAGLTVEARNAKVDRARFE